MIDVPEKKLNVFLHFRKAGGTRMVNLAIENGEKLWGKHDNGKPCTPFGSTIDLPSFSKEESLQFFEDAIATEISFVSVAGGYSILEAALSHPQVRTICSLRDPTETCLSNYNYDFYLAETHERKLSTYIENRGYSNPFMKSILHGEEYNFSSEESIEKAVEMLQRFDLCIELGHPESDTLLSNHLGWDCFDVKSHSTQGEDRLWKMVNMIKKGRFVRAVLLFLGNKRGTLEEVPLTAIKHDQELMNRLFKE